MRGKPQLLGGQGPGEIWRRYGVACLLTGAALAMRIALGPSLGMVQPFALFYISVAVSAWLGGKGPAILASIGGLFLGAFCFVEPALSGKVASLVPMLTFGIVCVGFIWLLNYAQQSEQRAERERASLDAVLDACPAGVIMADVTGKILRVNAANQRLWGGEPRSQTVEECCAWKGWWADGSQREGRRLEPKDWALARTLDGEVVPGEVIEIESLDSPQIRRTMLNCGAPVYGAEGQIIGGVVAQLDITDRKRVEAALAETKNQLEHQAEGLEKAVSERTSQLAETIHELEAFSYSLSHDLRAPLRAIKGFTKILESEYSPQLTNGARHYLGKIGVAASRLEQLIQDVLSYSKVGTKRIQLQPICVEALIRQLIEESPLLQPPNAEIEIFGPLPPVTGHQAYLSQVLSNLLYNAVKFVPKDRMPRVRIWSEPAEGWLLLCIQDNGIGIAEEARGDIFEVFQRLHSETEYEGTGIGLAIVRRAVDRMGGKVGVESNTGAGSTFWIQLRRPDPR